MNLTTQRKILLVRLAVFKLEMLFARAEFVAIKCPLLALLYMTLLRSLIKLACKIFFPQENVSKNLQLISLLLGETTETLKRSYL